MSACLNQNLFEIRHIKRNGKSTEKMFILPVVVNVKKDRRSPVVRKMCRNQVFESITASKIRKSTSWCRDHKGTDLASHVFRCPIESTQLNENVIFKIDFENAFNSMNRHFMCYDSRSGSRFGLN